MSRILLTGSVFTAFCMSHDFPFPRTFLPMVCSLEGSKWKSVGQTLWFHPLVLSGGDIKNENVPEVGGLFRISMLVLESSFPLSLSFFCIYVWVTVNSVNHFIALIHALQTCYSCVDLPWHFTPLMSNLHLLLHALRGGCVPGAWHQAGGQFGRKGAILAWKPGSWSCLSLWRCTGRCWWFSHHRLKGNPRHVWEMMRAEVWKKMSRLSYFFMWSRVKIHHNRAFGSPWSAWFWGPGWSIG